jgi:hypothetical protein
MKTIVTFYLAVIVTALLAVDSAAEEAKVLLRTDIPKPPFMSIQLYVPTNNMEPRLSGKRVFYVPAGTTNLALHQLVSASEKPTVGNLAMITDGDKDGADGSWMELPAWRQWIQIDLKTQAEIYAIIVWHYWYRPRVYLGVIAAVSDDPEFKKDVKVVFNNDVENAQGFGNATNCNYCEEYRGKLIDAKGVKGRYVRLYSNGNSENNRNQYVEVEVHGKATLENGKDE